MLGPQRMVAQALGVEQFPEALPGRRDVHPLDRLGGGTALGVQPAFVGQSGELAPRVVDEILVEHEAVTRAAEAACVERERAMARRASPRRQWPPWARTAYAQREAGRVLDPAAAAGCECDPVEGGHCAGEGGAQPGLARRQYRHLALGIGLVEHLAEAAPACGPPRTSIRRLMALAGRRADEGRFRSRSQRRGATDGGRAWHDVNRRRDRP